MAREQAQRLGQVRKQAQAGGPAELQGGARAAMNANLWPLALTAGMMHEEPLGRPQHGCQATLSGRTVQSGGHAALTEADDPLPLLKQILHGLKPERDESAHAQAAGPVECARGTCRGRRNGVDRDLALAWQTCFDAGLHCGGGLGCGVGHLGD